MDATGLTPDQFTFYTLVNISMQLTSCAVLFVLITSILLKEVKDRKIYIFLLLIVNVLLYTLSNIGIYFSNGKIEPFFRVLNEVSSFAAFTSEAFVFTIYMLYVLANVKYKIRRTFSEQWLIWLIGAITALLVLLNIMNLWNGMLYHINENNIFIIGDYYSLPYIFFLIQSILVVLLIVQFREYLAPHVISFICFIIMQFAAFFVYIVDPYMELTYVASMLVILFIYVDIQLKQEKRLVQQEMELANSRAATMLSQMQPHFLYNALAAIQRLIQKDPKLAEETVVEFSRYLRGNVDSLSQKKPISFEKELFHLESYLAIEKKRYGDKLCIIYDIAVRNFDIPALTVQPIAENAVRHGLTKKKNGGVIIISTAETETAIHITVADDGVGFDMDKPKQDGFQHIGIENVRNRLATMCGGTLTIQSMQGIGTTVIITIPKGGQEHDKHNHS